ncbi:MAG: hypothetical protein EBT36_13675 [Betaproteobacteria bacterium]|nr:hypothetical protein [Betaproteobacteria bacterium]
MKEPTALLHNMSAPPKSVVRYSGLSGLIQQRGPGGTGITSLRYRNGQQHGEAVRFELPVHFNAGSPADILCSLGQQHNSELHGSEGRYLLQLGYGQTHLRHWSLSPSAPTPSGFARRHQRSAICNIDAAFRCLCRPIFLAS